MWDMHDGMGWWMVAGTVWMVFFWGLVVWAVLRLNGAGSSQAGDSALETAKRRYAAGEISRDEFEQIRRDLD